MKKGFTLIELLVVISIIGILASLALASFSTAQKEAKDTQRKSDLAQYRDSLETYATKNNGIYFLHAASTDASGTLCTGLGLTSCPKDPKDPTTIYNYCTDSSGINYVLWASLENVSSYWTVCSNGRSGTSTTAPACGASFNCNLP